MAVCPQDSFGGCMLVWMIDKNFTSSFSPLAFHACPPPDGVSLLTFDVSPFTSHVSPQLGLISCMPAPLGSAPVGDFRITNFPASYLQIFPRIVRKRRSDKEMKRLRSLIFPLLRLKRHIYQFPNNVLILLE